MILQLITELNFAFGNKFLNDKNFLKDLNKETNKLNIKQENNVLFIGQWVLSHMSAIFIKEKFKCRVSCQ